MRSTDRPNAAPSPFQQLVRVASLALAVVVLTTGCTTPPDSGTAVTQEASTAATADATPSGGIPIEIGRSYVLDSEVFGARRTINVFLPPGYGLSRDGQADPEARYRVLYLLDGGVRQDFHHISGLAQLGTIVGMLPPMIVVGVETIDRSHELTHPSDDARYQEQWPTQGGAERFRRFLVDEVRPFVDWRFRTDEESLLIGESLAGLFVVDTFLRAPTAFQRYIAISPSLWWDNQSLSEEAAALLAAHPEGARSLWLTLADEGGTMQAGMDRLVAALEQGAPADLTWSYTPRPDETHATIYHGAALDALRALYPLPEGTFDLDHLPPDQFWWLRE